MTTFKVDHRDSPYHGREFTEYTKFKRYDTGLIVWIPLQIVGNQVRFFAQSNLKEVAALRNTVKAVDMEMVFTVEQAPIQGCAEPPPMVIFPMPMIYPQTVFLGIANGILERAKGQVIISLAIAESQLVEGEKAA